MRNKWHKCMTQRKRQCIYDNSHGKFCNAATSSETLLNCNSVKIMLYKTASPPPPPYFIVLPSSVKILGVIAVKAIEFHRIWKTLSRAILTRCHCNVQRNLLFVGYSPGSLKSKYNIARKTRHVHSMLIIVCLSSTMLKQLLNQH